ncbi:hypothetical protein [Wolinella succinogenes]
MDATIGTKDKEEILPLGIDVFVVQKEISQLSVGGLIEIV